MYGSFYIVLFLCVLDLDFLNKESFLFYVLEVCFKVIFIVVNFLNFCYSSDVFNLMDIV